MGWAALIELALRLLETGFLAKKDDRPVTAAELEAAAAGAQSSLDTLAEEIRKAREREAAAQ